VPSPRSLLRLRLLPWWLLYELANAASNQWRELEDADRERLRYLLGKSRGWPGNLTRRERDEVAQIAAQLDLRRLGRDVMPRVVERRLRRR
jgi:hypothetical protein